MAPNPNAFSQLPIIICSRLRKSFHWHSCAFWQACHHAGPSQAHAIAYQLLYENYSLIQAHMTLKKLC